MNKGHTGKRRPIHNWDAMIDQPRHTSGYNPSIAGITPLNLWEENVTVYPVAVVAKDDAPASWINTSLGTIQRGGDLTYLTNIDSDYGYQTRRILGSNDLVNFFTAAVVHSDGVRVLRNAEFLCIPTDSTATYFTKGGATALPIYPDNIDFVLPILQRDGSPNFGDYYDGLLLPTFLARLPEDPLEVKVGWYVGKVWGGTANSDRYGRLPIVTAGLGTYRPNLIHCSAVPKYDDGTFNLRKPNQLVETDAAIMSDVMVILFCDSYVWLEEYPDKLISILEPLPILTLASTEIVIDSLKVDWTNCQILQENPRAAVTFLRPTAHSVKQSSTTLVDRGGAFKVYEFTLPEYPPYLMITFIPDNAASNAVAARHDKGSGWSSKYRDWLHNLDVSYDDNLSRLTVGAEFINSAEEAGTLIIHGFY